MIKNSPLIIAVTLSLTAATAVTACSSRDLTHDRYQGMVELEETDLAFDLPGRVTAVLVRPGEDVAAGAVLARLDDDLAHQAREIRARELEVARAELALVQAGSRTEDVRAARARLEAARTSEQTLRRQLARDRSLVESGALAGAIIDDTSAALARATGERAALEQQVRALAGGARSEELARASARVASAQQALALEDARLARHELRASGAGTVLDTYIEPGEVVAAGAAVATVVDRNRPYADVFVPVPRASTLTIGAPASLAVEGSPAEVAGVVERIFPHAEFTPRFIYSPRERPNLMIRVRVRLDDRDHRLFAGLPAYARLPAAADARGAAASTAAGAAP